MKYLMILITFAFTIAQPKQAQAKSGFPSLLFAPAAGYETGDLGGSTYDGPAGQLRLVKLFDTYPFTLVGLDAKYSRMNFGDGTNADRISGNVVGGFMVPLDLFGINLKNVPKGAGPPIYVSYSFYDRVSTIDTAGTGFRAGLQLPAGPFAALQVEYAKSKIDNQDLQSWNFYLQFFLPITKF